MPLLTVYRGDSAVLPLYFTNPDGTPRNVSGYGVFLGVAYDYSTTPFVYIGTTGGPEGTTGYVSLVISSGDTNYCAGDYPANVRAISPTSGVITYSGQGLTILPTVLPYV